MARNWAITGYIGRIGRMQEAYSAGGRIAVVSVHVDEPRQRKCSCGVQISTDGGKLTTRGLETRVSPGYLPRR